jgi:hypothetical protein
MVKQPRDVPPTHSPDKKGKRLKEYFYEFFMLFLAVTAGFYADNLREKFVDKNKEHEYMQSMVEDLQQDMLHLNSVVAELKTFKAGLDSLALTTYANLSKDSIQRTLYDLNLRYLRLVPVTFSDRTSSQLKNSGSMRLIRNKMVADSILNYWQQIDYFNYVSRQHESFRLKARELSLKIFDYGYYSSDLGFIKNNLVRPRPQLLTTDKLLISEYANYVWAGRASLFLYYYPPIVKLQSQAQNLISLINKEYRLKGN